MVRKVIPILMILLMLLNGFAVAASAESYTVYDGNPSSTYITYFKDIIPNISLNDHYVAFRSGQYEYTMIVGDLVYNNGSFTLNDSATVYSITSNNSYNGYYAYNVSSIDSLSLSVGDKIIYSDLGNFPQLEERGQKYEILQTLLLFIALLCVVIRSMFGKRIR